MPTTHHQLGIALQDEWNHLNQADLRWLVRSTPSWIGACLANRGRFTQYWPHIHFKVNWVFDSTCMFAFIMWNPWITPYHVYLVYHCKTLNISYWWLFDMGYTLPFLIVIYIYIYSRTCLWRPLVGLDKSGRHREVAAICRSYVSPNF